MILPAVSEPRCPLPTVSISPVEGGDGPCNGQIHSSTNFPETKILPSHLASRMENVQWKEELADGAESLEARLQSLGDGSVGHREPQKVLELGWKRRPVPFHNNVRRVYGVFFDTRSVETLRNLL